MATITRISTPRTINGVPNTNVYVKKYDPKGNLVSSSVYSPVNTPQGKMYSVNKLKTGEKIDWNNVSGGQIKASGFDNLSAWKSAYESGKAQAPSNFVKTGSLSTGGGVYSNVQSGEQVAVQATPKGVVSYSSSGVYTGGKGEKMSVSSNSAAQKIISQMNSNVPKVGGSLTSDYFLKGNSSSKLASNIVKQNSRNDFYESSLQVGRKAVRGDLIGAGQSFGYAFLSGVKQSGELISDTTQGIVKQVPYSNKDIFSLNPLDRGKVAVNIGAGFIGGLGKFVSGSAFLVRESPSLIGAGVVAIPGVFSEASKNPVLFGVKASSKVPSFLGGVFSSELSSFSANPAYYTGEFIGATFYGGKTFEGAGKLVQQSGLKASAFISGAKYVPGEKIIAPEVLKGLKLFPEISKRGNASQVLKNYYNQPFSSALGKGKVVYSATDYPFLPVVDRTIKVSSGRGLIKGVDVPGLYTSTKGVSKYFLRMENSVKDYSLSLLPGNPFKSPKILAIYTKPSGIPSSYLGNLNKAQSFFGKSGLSLTTPKGVPGVPYVSPAVYFGKKIESEAVIQVGSNLERVGLDSLVKKIVGFDKFTKIQGKIVPIYEYSPIGSSAVKSVFGNVNPVKYANYSSGVSDKALLSYSNLAGLGVSYKGSVDSNSSVSYLNKQNSFFDYGSSKKSSKVSSSVVNDYFGFGKSSKSLTIENLPGYPSKPSSKGGSYYSPVISKSYVPEFVPGGNSRGVSYKGRKIKLPSYSSYVNSSYRIVSPFKSYAQKKNYFNDDFNFRKKIRKFVYPKAYFKPYKSPNLANMILPIKTNWLKQVKYFGNVKNPVKSIGLLPNQFKGNKQVAGLLGLSFKWSLI